MLGSYTHIFQALVRHISPEIQLYNIKTQSFKEIFVCIAAVKKKHL